MFNIGGDGEISILELAKLIAGLMDDAPPLQLEFVPYASFSDKPYEDVMRRVPDTTFAEHKLGFRAKVPLDEGLRRTIEWQRSVRR